MEISNQKRSKQIKGIFNITGIFIVMIGLIFLWFKMDIGVLITAGVFIVFVGASQFANLCFVNFSTQNSRVTIKYYPIISLFKKNYETVEFAQQNLVNFKIEKSLGFADLDIVIRTKRGIAEYPTISLAAMSSDEISQISQALQEIMRNNR